MVGLRPDSGMVGLRPDSGMVGLRPDSGMSVHLRPPLAVLRDFHRGC